MDTLELLKKACGAKGALSLVTSEEKNEALTFMAEELVKAADEILLANTHDVTRAVGRLSVSMIDRLKLTKERIQAMADGILCVRDLPDPVGETLSETVRPNGLRIRKKSVPMGVIAIIYESRPNVTSDAAALALKAGSAVVLRSGRDAHESASAIVEALKRGIKRSALPEDALFLVEDTSRESAETLMKAKGCVDLLIPRGGKGLIRSCVENAVVPVLETGTGICHIYVDKTADQNAALAIIENAKCSRPSVCNAEEVLLVNEEIAGEFLPKLISRLTAERQSRNLPPVELHLSGKALSLAGEFASDASSESARLVTLAGDDDFDTEFLDYKLAVDVVRDVKAAVSHVNAHSTHHSESILTHDPKSAAYFTQCIDSACVYVNASTRFTDGGEFGMGAEMGISTQKLHARGPVGLRELCSYKYVIEGVGQIR